MITANFYPSLNIQLAVDYCKFLVSYPSDGTSKDEARSYHRNFTARRVLQHRIQAILYRPTSGGIARSFAREKKPKLQ